MLHVWLQLLILRVVETASLWGWIHVHDSINIFKVASFTCISKVLEAHAFQRMEKDEVISASDAGKYLEYWWREYKEKKQEDDRGKNPV